MTPKLSEVFRFRESTGGVIPARMGRQRGSSFPYPQQHGADEDEFMRAELGEGSVCGNLQSVDLDEAAAGDRATIKHLGKEGLKRLKNWPWKRSAKTLSPRETRFYKPIGGYDEDGVQQWKVDCFITIMPASDHSHHTGRGGTGGGKGGWMVDCEIRLHDSDPLVWVWHAERRYPTEVAASKAQANIMEFVDGNSLLSLMDEPRSGPLSMSAWRDDATAAAG